MVVDTDIKISRQELQDLIKTQAKEIVDREKAKMIASGMYYRRRTIALTSAIDILLSHSPESYELKDAIIRIAGKYFDILEEVEKTPKELKQSKIIKNVENAVDEFDALLKSVRAKKKDAIASALKTWKIHTKKEIK